MLDFTHLPSNVKADIQVFNTPNTWQQWIKPRGVSMVYMFCIGGGGGGGSGASTSLGSAGTGGGSSCQSTLIIPSFMIPDTLSIKVGQGGSGALGVLNAVGNRGLCGSNSIIAVESESSISPTILEYFGTGITLAAASPHITMASTTGIEVGMHVSYNAANGTGTVPTDATVLNVLSGTTIQLSANSTAGTSGNASALRFIRKTGVLLTATGGIGGPGGTNSVGPNGTITPINTIAQCPLAGLGRYNFIAGQAGTAGSDVGNTGAAITYATTTGLIVMGGSGGGAPTGGTATGMALTAAGVFPGVAGAAIGKGSNGFSLNPPRLPLRFTGGLGGAGGATSSSGGDGAYGCGGGGSGGCPTTATSSIGGRGGDGLVIISSW